MSIPGKACSVCYLCAKNFYNPSKFGKVLTKNEFAQFFFETRCTSLLLLYNNFYQTVRVTSLSQLYNVFKALSFKTLSK